MSKKGTSLAELAEMLPPTTRKKLNLTDFKSLTGAMLVKDRIEQHYDFVYQSEARLRKWKRTQGYCGGRPYCLTLTGPKEFYCDACKKEMARISRGETRRIKRSEYGRIRAKERAQEKLEKERKQ